MYRARVHHAEVAHAGKPFTFRPANHAHEVYHLVLVTSGKGHFRLGSQLLPVARKSLVATSPGEPHCFERVQGETTGYAEVTFDFVGGNGSRLQIPFAEMLACWSGEASACRNFQTVSEASVQSLERALQELIRPGLTILPERMALRSSCALMRILEQCQEATRWTPVPAAPWEKARLFLLENYRTPVPISHLAERLGVHPDYLARSFRKAYGVSPLSFQNSLKLEAAKSWLLSTDYPLKEIADRTGFQDAGYLARLFRNRVGRSPGRFRAQGRSSS